MAWLLIDNSNTRTKFRLGDEDGLLEWSAVWPTKELDHSSISELLEKVSFSAVVIASVVPKTEGLLRGFFEKHACHFVTEKSPLGYGLEVDAPEQVGHDRLANLVALKQHYGSPSVAIDFGTAVTFSVLSVSGNFTGGVIAPGMGCMTEYLSEKTAQLPWVSAEEHSTAIGKNTIQALQIGAVAGHRGMVREILFGIASEIGKPMAIVATGGGAAFAAKGLPEISKTNPDLTLEGLRLIATRVF